MSLCWPVWLVSMYEACVGWPVWFGAALILPALTSVAKALCWLARKACLERPGCQGVSLSWPVWLVLP